MEEGLRADEVKVAGVLLDFVADNSNQPWGSFKSNVDTRTIRVDRQHDGMHRPPSFASFIYEESSQTKVNVCTLKTEVTELADVLIPMSSVLEVHVRFENTLYGYFLGKKVAYLVVERYILNAWKKYGVKRVMRDKNDSKELTFAPVWIKFHGVPVSAFTADGPSAIANHIYAILKCPKCVIVDLRKQGGTSNDGFQVVQKKGVRDPLVSKHGTEGNHSLPKQQVPESAYQKKTTSTPVSNAFFALGEDNRKPMDDLVDGTRKKARVPLRKTGIWSGRKAEYDLELEFTSTSGNPTPSGPIIASSSPSFTPFEGRDFILKEIETFLRTPDELNNLDDDYYDTKGGILYLEKLLNEDPSPNLPPMKNEDLKQVDVTMTKPSIEEPPELELKDLPSHLEYPFLEGIDKLPVIISKELKDEEKAALLKVLKSHKRAIAWKISNIKGIDPRFCTHKILMEDDFKPAVQHQRRVNPKILEVIKKEVIKLLEAGLIYPISITRGLAIGWRVCIDYRKLNDATRKDHFPLPFMDQMLERLAGNEYYCFLDGFSRYFQIPIDPQDQEKTTFTCPYGTFAYRHMPFGLCNASGTFQSYSLLLTPMYCDDAYRVTPRVSALAGCNIALGLEKSIAKSLLPRVRLVINLSLFCRVLFKLRNMDEGLQADGVKVLEVHVRFENTLYGYFLRKKVAYRVVERYILNAWQKYGVKRVMRDKNGSSSFNFPMQLVYKGFWSKRGTSNDGLQDVQKKGVRDPLVSKHGTKGNHSLPKQQLPESAYQKKTTSTPISNAFFSLEEDNRKPMDDLVNGTRKKVRVPLRKACIWSGRKAKYYLESEFTSPNPFGLLTKKIGIVFCVIYMRVVMMGRVFYVINRRVMMILK
nr:reverse transcriptase domain-containing protein [Tanacetum cinerariifolium]